MYSPGYKLVITKITHSYWDITNAYTTCKTDIYTKFSQLQNFK